MSRNELYYRYSDYLKHVYGEKVYKLPVNLPVSCPNRISGKSGCTFCAGVGTGFEAMDSFIPVQEQLKHARNVVEEKYHAHKFIAYFQNYTNTFLPLIQFKQYMQEAASVPDIVEIAVSTRPDCIREDYLTVLSDISMRYGCRICIELGLQTANYHTLHSVDRGHGLAEFIDAVRMIQLHGFDICTHVILNLPGDNREDSVETAKILSALRITAVKIHSLYIAKDTKLCEAYENGTISVCTKEEYMERLMMFLEYLDPGIAVERLFSRIPAKDSVFCNWNTSWWKLKEETEQTMVILHRYQGKHFHYLNGAALRDG